MKEGAIWVIIGLVSFLAGLIVGFLATRYFLTKQVREELKKRMEEPDKEQVRNMLSALGKKPSEKQVNRFINMTKSSAKKDQNNSKKGPLKKKKITKK